MHDRTQSYHDPDDEPSGTRRWWPFGKSRAQKFDAQGYAQYLQSKWGDDDDDAFETPSPKRSWWPFGKKAKSDSGYSSIGWEKGEADAPREAYVAPEGGYNGSPAFDDPPAKPKRSRWWWFSRGLGALFLLFLVMLLWLAITAPLSKSLQPIAPPQITLTASDGTPIARNGAVVDEPVEIDELPPHVVNAFLAIEDRRFYSHLGIDPRGLARALFKGVGGGSTITQQLAKFTFLTPERTLTRKAREMLIAFWLEARLSKDEILERYLSNAYFGDNVYGLRAASLHYFYRQPERLKPEQAMMLAGLVQAPSRLAPTKNISAARKRAALVKNAMVDAGFMSEAEAGRLPRAEIDVRTRNTLPTGTYFADWAMPQARAREEFGYSKQTIATTLDADLQKAARRAIGRAGLGKAQVALVAMRPTGEVVAMVGGRNYAKSAFNRATQAKRQPGSTFKLFVYLAALQSGMRPGSMVDDSEITAGSYRPKNARGRYRGEITLKEAFAQSSNVAAVRLFNRVGDDAVIRSARDLGISAKLPKGDPSIALGSSTTTLLELTSAYAALAADSYPVKARAFEAEEEGWFDWLFAPERSFDSRVLGDMEEMLRYAVNSGTGRNARLKIANYGKTGTSQDSRDAIFVGYAGDLVVGVWVGNDDNSPLRGVNGGTIPARIWRDFMNSALGIKTPSRPARPKPAPKADDPIEKLDLPEIPDLPDEVNIGDAGIRLDPEDGVTIQTDIEGVPLDIRLGRDGIDVGPREDESADRN